MYLFFHNFLEDKKGGDIFVLFGVWHFLYIILTAVIILAVCFAEKRRYNEIREKTTRFFINLAFILYLADFFLMPLSYGEINIEKLPFHVCTTMCVMCFLSYQVKFLKKYRLSFVLLGLISNVVYLIYPAGVMWYEVHPMSYRVIQTLGFHSIMSIYAALTLIREYKRFEIKKCYRDFAVVVAMTMWALVGNYIYNGNSEDYSHFFNWFFVVRDPFYIFPEKIAPFIMPILNISMFVAVEMIIHLGIRAIKLRLSGVQASTISQAIVENEETEIIY